MVDDHQKRCMKECRREGGRQSLGGHKILSRYNMMMMMMVVMDVIMTVVIMVMVNMMMITKNERMPKRWRQPTGGADNYSLDLGC